MQASTSTVQHHLISQYSVDLRLFQERGKKNVAAGEGLETEDVQFIQRECRTRVGEGHRGLEWLVNDLASPREYAGLLEKQFPGQFVINSQH